MDALSQQPLDFFEEFLQLNKISYLKNRMIDDFIENGGHMGIESIDRGVGILRFHDIYGDDQNKEPIEGIGTWSFDSHFFQLLRSEFGKSLNILDNDISNIVKQGNNPTEYILLQTNLIKKLEQRAQEVYPHTPIVKETIKELLAYLNNKYCNEDPVSVENRSNNLNLIENPEDYSPDSFLWDSIDNNLREEQLTKLFELLSTNPKIIDCQFEDFINAFSQKTVVNGIKWCIKGKSGKMSIHSIWYFVNSLNSGYIQQVPSMGLNRKIHYVFRYTNGELISLEGIKSSKSYSSRNPQDYERIDSILEDVLKP